MSERIVSDPSQHGWVEENGKWVWDGQPAGAGIEDGDTVGQITTWGGTEWTPESAVVVDASGNVGIGMAPLTFDLSAKEQLAEWKTKAKKASWPIVTDGAFEQEPTEDLVEQWIETRAAGDKLQVAGSASLQDAGATYLLKVSGARGGSQIHITPNKTDTNAGIYSPLSGSGTVGFGLITNKQIHFCTGTTDQSGNTNKRLTIDAAGDATFSGSVDAAGFTINGTPIGGGGLPDGDFTHNGKITATDFIATSDERVKDNITTAPVGLIDSLKGREWDWRESGEKGSGVVAQELEEVLPHLVHTDDEGMKSVAYNGLVAYLIEEVKALKDEIKEIKNG